MKKPESIEAIYREASPEAKKLIKKILELEKEKLYMSRPRIKEDILAAFKREIR